ncbi:PREDICTED: uncharacterized protein LOC105971463 [Erythranthe guttata]|uniref:uncharacterized protein LOC105971463 n=1 Tax=Erythranthe guttata TaxID=4155 RepID=UPI00064DA377|nr:PREDICTED: uncharacterized protein LOC105971463 [Erythranthe guttata]|eukprot:XP_012851770.1 PREDICTED: uncharacterized protein LOC105971463 [Erythranthe guttata]
MRSNRSKATTLQSNVHVPTCQITDGVFANACDPTGNDNMVDIVENVVDIVDNKQKRVRGATCMPKVWGQQPDELVVVSFNELGQPKDQDKTSTLSHFLGTIARNGRYCPLNYEDWRLMPYSYKEEMLKIVKARFELPPGHESYILRSINKKWRNWKSSVKSLNFDPDISTDQQTTKIPDRVNEDQYKSLVHHWMSDKSKERSKKNKNSRGELKLFHCMGKKSFAVVKEKLKEKLGRYPTRAELFEECYYKEDSSSTSEAVKGVVGKMRQLAPQYSQNIDNHQDSNMYNDDDLFAKVMGKDKDGHVRMYGLGVTPADVYGEKPSRSTLLRKAMEYKTKYLEAMKKYDTLSANVHVGQSDGQLEAESFPEQEIAPEKSPIATPNEQNDSFYVPNAFLSEQVGAQSPSLSVSNEEHSFRTSSLSTSIKGGSYVVLKSLANMNEIVATGIVDKMDHISVNGIDLGPDFCQVVIQYPVNKDARLVLPYNHIQTIGNAIGVPVAWPISLVALDDEFHY